ncbi:MAG: DNA polymerase III subunit gamma/tau, partial [Betaproteobacteria bacterium]|nr:DNA polymerase III subunit gamma/tau [Betaproteobacteria bacterium]
PAAVRLLARRAAGSVRDAMSLMGQALALGGEALSEQGTRQVLGLAGQELFGTLLDAVASGDCAAVSILVRGLQDQGVDIGFFLRELGALWRSLFLLRQAGADVLPALELPVEEGQELLARAASFSLAHIHAAWQMVLDAQRRVILSLEPASALELLLLNLALLPRLVPVEQAPPPQGTGGFKPSLPNSGGPPQSSRSSCGVQAKTPAASPLSTQGADTATPAASPASRQSADTAPTADTPILNWKNFLEFCAQHHTQPAFLALPLPILRQVIGRFDGTTLHLACTTDSQHQQLRQDAVLTALQDLLRKYGGSELALLQPAASSKSKAELKKEFSSHPRLQALKEQFDAQIVTCTPLNGGTRVKPALKENKV